MATRFDRSKLETDTVAGLVRPAATVLDLGCGDGYLLHLLMATKRVRGQGIEISDQSLFRCVEKGLTVLQEDIDDGLPDFTNDSFEYVILNNSFQQVKNPDTVLQEALRVGSEVILGIPNFAYWRGRFQIFFRGRTPVTKSLPFAWHDTPNLHFLSLRDFLEYCRDRAIIVEDFIPLGRRRRIHLLPNLTAESAVFRLRRNGRDEVRECDVQ